MTSLRVDFNNDLEEDGLGRGREGGLSLIPGEFTRSAETFYNLGHLLLNFHSDFSKGNQ